MIHFMTSLRSAKLLAFYGALDLEGPWQCPLEDRARCKGMLGLQATEKVGRRKLTSLTVRVLVMSENADASTRKRARQEVCTLTPQPLLMMSARLSLVSFPCLQILHAKACAVVQRMQPAWKHACRVPLILAIRQYSLSSGLISELPHVRL